MLSVSPSGPSYLADRRITSACTFQQDYTNDAILGGGWDHEPICSRPSTSCAAGSSPGSSIAMGEEDDCDSTPSDHPSSSSSRALLIRSKCQGWERSFELHHDWIIPELISDDEVLIQNIVVGLNPVDFKSVLYNFGIAGTPWVLGRDIAGVVCRKGKAVENVDIGQRVWLCADSRDRRSGAYQAYSIARSSHLGRIADEMTDEDAATLGTGLVTAAIAAYWFFGWQRALVLGGEAMPKQQQQQQGKRAREEDQTSEKRRTGWVLIYGGASCTGLFMTQLARLSGFQVICIASPDNFAYLQHLGAAHCVDRYLEPEEIQEQVLSLTGSDCISYCLDTVGSKTATIAHGILQSAGKSAGEMICLAGDPKTKSVNAHSDRPAKMRKAINGASSGLLEKDEPRRAITVHKISFSTTFYGDDVFAKQVMADMEQLLASKQLYPARPEVYPDGLAGVRKGLEALRDDTAPRARKLVVRIQDTPNAESTHLGVRTETGWNGAV